MKIQKLSRFCCVLMIIFLFMSLMLVAVQADSDFIKKDKTYIFGEDAEIFRAINGGLVPSELQSDYDSQITYKEFVQLLSQVVSKYDRSLLPQWQTVSALPLASDRPMLRQDGALTLFYAAEVMGQCQCNDWGIILRDITEQKNNEFWDDMNWEYPEFPNYGTPASTVSYDGIVTQWDSHMIAASFFALGRLSPISDMRLLMPDTKGYIRWGSIFTRQDAICAVCRLYDSSGKVDLIRVPTELDKVILAEADFLREAILNSETSIVIKGTKYYVSNNGNDKNDGLSPETAWATLNKVQKVRLKEGDGVLFRRGDMWRGRLYAQSGVTYSAYGTGEKPKLYGSPENGADPKKWKLLKGTMNIWVFYRNMQDLGGIVLNDGEIIAQKRCAWWDGKYFYDFGETQAAYEGDTKDLKRYDTKTMLGNLRFFNEVRFKEVNGFTHISIQTGKLYLRCDAGNPGTVFESIEFIGNDMKETNFKGMVIGDGGYVIDNLCFLYGAHGVDLTENSTIQNCEVGYMGGIVMAISAGWAKGGIDAPIITRSGDGIYAGGVNNTVVNNYVHDIWDYGVTVEGTRKGYHENVRVFGNLIERCFGGVILTDFVAYNTNTPAQLYNNIVIDDNYILHSGFGWGHLIEDDLKGNALAFVMNPESNQGVYVTNNVLYHSSGQLVAQSSCENVEPLVFSGNTYGQYAFNDNAIQISGHNWNTEYRYSLNLQKILVDVLGDINATVVLP